MKNKIKNLGILTLVILVLPLLIQTTNAQPETSISDKALTFITDVLQLDEEHYNSSLIRYNKSPASPTVTEEQITYNLQNDDTTITASCIFKNKLLFSCMVSVPKSGSLIYTQQPDNALALIKGIMDRYQAFIRDSSVTEMANILHTVETAANATLQKEDIKLEIINSQNGISFYWKHIYNGVEYNELNIVSMQNRLIFADLQSRYKMGSTDVKIPMEKALDIAINFVENYSYKAIGGLDGNETELTVSNFNISRKLTTAQLAPAEKDGLLYPCWDVKVALNGRYPGNVFGFSVGIWADSGKVFACNPSAVGMDFQTDGISPLFPSIDDQPAGTSNPEQNNNTRLIDNANIVITVAVLSVITLVIIVVAIKKRRSN